MKYPVLGVYPLRYLPKPMWLVVGVVHSVNDGRDTPAAVSEDGTGAIPEASVMQIDDDTVVEYYLCEKGKMAMIAI